MKKDILDKFVSEQLQLEKAASELWRKDKPVWHKEKSPILLDRRINQNKAFFLKNDLKKFDPEYLKTEEGLIEYYWDRRGFDLEDIRNDLKEKKENEDAGMDVLIKRYGLDWVHDDYLTLAGINRIIDNTQASFYYNWNDYYKYIRFDIFMLIRMRKYFPNIQRILDDFRNDFNDRVKRFPLFNIDDFKYDRDPVGDFSDEHHAKYKDIIEPILKYESKKYISQLNPKMREKDKFRAQYTYLYLQRDFYDRLALEFMDGCTPKEEFQKIILNHPFFYLAKNDFAKIFSCSDSEEYKFADPVFSISYIGEMLSNVDPNSPIEGEDELYSLFTIPFSKINKSIKASKDLKCFSSYNLSYTQPLWSDLIEGK